MKTLRVQLVTPGTMRAATLVVFFALGACRSAPRASSDTLTGAATPRGAVESFLGAVHAQDLQALSTVWGTASGPVRDNQKMDRAQIEKRELIMICYFGHDKYRIGDDQLGEGGRRIFRVELTKGSLTREPTFKTVKGPGDRWYVEDADISVVKDFCSQRQNGG